MSRRRSGYDIIDLSKEKQRHIEELTALEIKYNNFAKKIGGSHDTYSTSDN